MKERITLLATFSNIDYYDRVNTDIILNNENCLYYVASLWGPYKVIIIACVQCISYIIFKHTFMWLRL